MTHGFWRTLVATIGLTVALRSAAYAGRPTLSLSTASLVPNSDGYLYCKVVARSSKGPIGMIATILAEDGTNVTDFGHGARWSPLGSADGLYHAEQTAGSINDNARFCLVTVVGARKRDIYVSLTAYDVNNQPVASVEALPRREASIRRR